MSADHGATVTSVAHRHSPALMVVVIAYLVFIFLGIPDGMLGIAWPSMRGDFSLALGQMGVLLAASTAGFLITSFSAGRLITVLGVARLLIITTILRGVALIGMGLAPSWPGAGGGVPRSSDWPAAASTAG
jgi:MFS family permease